MKAVFPESTGKTLRFGLTPSRIERLIAEFRNKRREVRKVVADERCPGLRLVIGARTATWTYSYRPRGTDHISGKRHKQKVITIGDAANVSLDDARTFTAKLRASVSAGHDPAAERASTQEMEINQLRAAEKEKSNRLSMITKIVSDKAPAGTLDFSALRNASLADCVRAFVLHGARGKAKSVAEVEMHLRLGIAEMDAAGLLPSELPRSRVSAMVRQNSERRATARHRLSALGRLYKWLQCVDAADSSPASNQDAPPPPAPRTRVFTALEVQALWTAADHLRQGRGDLLRLMLLLPLRRDEIASSHVGDVRQSGDRLELVIRAERSKNRREHIVPLVGVARAIVESNIDGRPKNAFLLPLTQTGKPFLAWTNFTGDVANQTGFAFRPHDCRRLFASEAGEHELGDFGAIDGALNHAQSATISGAARHYHHGRAIAARQRVLDDWGRLVSRAVATGRWPREDPDTEERIIRFGVVK